MKVTRGPINWRCHDKSAPTGISNILLISLTGFYRRLTTIRPLYITIRMRSLLCQNFDIGKGIAIDYKQIGTLPRLYCTDFVLQTKRKSCIAG